MDILKVSKCPFMSRAQQPVVLENLQDKGNVLFDTLHGKAIKRTDSKDGFCNGALMQPDNLITLNKLSSSDIKSEAMDFFNQYFSTPQHRNSKAKNQDRLNTVVKALDSSDFYVHSLEELEFGSKTAWRNAPRCIGRIQWNNLQLFDGRDIQSTDDMSDMICEHIKYGTNQGNLRSAITVFPSSQSGVQCRIWNRQYLSYAGFKNADGTITGDPATVEFTNICLKLGWKPKRTRFTILPLLLQYGDEDPKLYDLPASLVLEVPITHPRYPGLESLKLKWYALPAVCDMSFHCGGIIYQTCGFNGWYMSTEIVRDLLDVQRYNMMKEIAEAMGFDTNLPAFHWKDILAAELNIAVLSSFERDNVTITDHHTASDSFVQHMQSEQFMRGGCPADWVWITPPQGGALTSVFHQEMINYKLKPSFEYQVQIEVASGFDKWVRPLKPTLSTESRPWEGYKWKNNQLKSNVRKTKLTFRMCARAAMISHKLMSYILKQRKTCTILYATETGQSLKFANKLQNKLLERGFNTEVSVMSSYDVNRLENESLLLIVTSTFGTGEAPDNGKSFGAYLRKLEERGHKFTNQVRYAVFGLGSSAYPNFCAFAHTVNRQLQNAGFDRLVDIHTADQKKNQERSYQLWSQALVAEICKVYGLKDTALTPDMESVSCHHKLARTKKQPSSIVNGLSMIHQKDVKELEAISVKSLIKPDGHYAINLIKLHGDNIKYEPGDHLVVFPVNSHKRVVKFCDHLIFEDGITPNTAIELKLLKSNKNIDQYESHMPVTSMANALTYYLDIETQPTQDDIRLAQQNSKCSPEEKKQLHKMSTDFDTYNDWAETKPSWIDLITQFPSLRIPAAYVLAELPRLKPRYYSISSSIKAHPSEVHLTVSRLHYTIKTNDGETVKYGLCSSWLQDLLSGSSVRAYISRNDKFHLREHNDVIMIGTGSGMAPFRGFWEERKVLSHSDDGVIKTPEKLYLFQGARTHSTLLFGDEIQQAEDCEVISHAYNAFSREENIEKTYVQDKLRKQYRLIYNLLVYNRAHVYVCGNDRMAAGVADSIRSILEGHSIDKASLQLGNKKHSGEAKLTLEQLRAEGRYHEDIFI